MATTSSASRNFPTLRYLVVPFRWFFRSRRRVLTVAAMLLAMIVVPPLWWSLQLVGLPDIGEPFDVAAFRKFTIPDDRNAFLLYLEAADRLKPLHASSKAHAEKIDLNAPGRRPTRRSADGSRRTARRWTGIASGPSGPMRSTRPCRRTSIPRSWTRPCDPCINSPCSRRRGRRSSGDMAGAWTWYRAALRTTHHMTLHASFSMRLRAEGRNGKIRQCVSKWAVDPRTTPALLRRALDDVVACGSFTPSDSYTIKVGYPFDERLLDGPYNPGRQLLIARLTAALSTPSFQPDTDQVRALADAWRFWRREPERSRRVMRLAIANRLAYDALPPERRPGPDPHVTGPLDFYALGPEAPAKARALSPAALDRWLTTATDAQELLRNGDLQGLRMRERANHRALVVLLAGELYRRDHGADPPSDEALVGPYLKELPDDGPGEAERQATPDAGETPSARDRPGGSDDDGIDFEREPQLPDAPIPGRAVPLVLPEPSAGDDCRCDAAGDDRRAAAVVVASNWPACRTSASRSTWRRSGRSASPTIATRSCCTRGGGPAQAVEPVRAKLQKQLDPRRPLVGGRPGGPPMGRGEPRGDGDLSPGDGAARRARPGPDRPIRTRPGGPSGRLARAGPARGVAAGGAGRHGGGLGLVSGGAPGDPPHRAARHDRRANDRTEPAGSCSAADPEWATDPRTTLDHTPPGLDDVVACGALAPSESYTLKAESP